MRAGGAAATGASRTSGRASGRRRAPRRTSLGGTGRARTSTHGVNPTAARRSGPSGGGRRLAQAGGASSERDLFLCWATRSATEGPARVKARTARQPVAY